MKSLSLALGLLFSLGVNKAYASLEVDEVINDSITFYNITVGSTVASGVNQVSTATLASGATTFQNLLENRKSIAVQNLGASANIFCEVGLSSTSANGDLSLSAPSTLSTTTGIKVGPGGLLTLNLKARDQSGRVFVPYCVNDGATGTVTLEVIQSRSK